MSKRVAFVDVRNCVAYSNIRYDRQGKLWSNFEMSHGQLKGGGADGKRLVRSTDGKEPQWTWIYPRLGEGSDRGISPTTRTPPAEASSAIDTRVASAAASSVAARPSAIAACSGKPEHPEQGDRQHAAGAEHGTQDRGNDRRINPQLRRQPGEQRMREGPRDQQGRGNDVVVEIDPSMRTQMLE